MSRNQWVTQGLYEQVIGGIIAGIITAIATMLMTRNLWLGLLFAVLIGVGIALVIGGLVRDRGPTSESYEEPTSHAEGEISESLRFAERPGLVADSEPPTLQDESRLHKVVEDLEPYDKVLRKAMCRALSRPDLRLLCADLGFGTDFVEGEKLELECQRVINECKHRGRAKMETLLKLLRALPTDWTFPNLPPEGDPWWVV